MEKISVVIKKKKIKVRKSTTRRRGNPLYGVAMDISREFNISIGMSFKLMKTYGPKKVATVRSWWSDYPFKKKNNIGLLIWKLKQA